jgi:acetyl-CoA carboxylase biotin carboxyl carrier protein
MARATDSNLPFDAEDLAEVLAVLEKSAYDELYLETDRFKLTLRRGREGVWTQEMQALVEPRIDRGTPQEPAQKAKLEPATAQQSASAQGLVDVPAPMVGTFYRAPKPGAEPFVKAGSHVESDTIIGIIEVMKLMNSIRAGVAGEVVEICAENGVLIEKGQPILRVRPKSA